LVRFSFIVQQLTELRRSQNLLWNLTLRELRSKYRRSFLGWAWSMLNPLSNMVIYWFVFGVVFGATAPTGDPSGIQVYALYLLTGILPWGFFDLSPTWVLAHFLATRG